MSLLTVMQTAERLGMHANTVRAIPLDMLPVSYTPKGHRRYREEDVEKYTGTHTNTSVPPYIRLGKEKEVKYLVDCILKAVPDVEKIYLFGSYAYGTPRADSDFDVFVVLPDSESRTNCFVSGIIGEKIGLTFTYAVDIITTRASRVCVSDEFNTVDSEAIKKGVLIYEQ